MPEWIELAATGAALLLAGLAAGWINTLAGGGSNITLPLLMVFGLPADVANATNRVGVLAHSWVGTREFQRRGQLDTSVWVPVLIPTVLGGLAGSLAASFMPVGLLKPVLLATVLLMTLVTVLVPGLVHTDPGRATLDLRHSVTGGLGLFVCGLYGGFVQAGVGFLFIAVLAGLMGFDIVRTNGLKLLGTLGITLVAMAVFISRGQVAWSYGLVLAVGMMAGARWGVAHAVSVSAGGIKALLLVMTTVACVAAWWAPA